MKQPDKYTASELNAISNNTPEEVKIKDTKRTVKIRGIKPYTTERLTSLWIKRDLSRPENGEETVSAMSKDPYFNYKIAALFVLNGFFKINLFWGILWRWWAYVREYEEYQLFDIITTGKKKIPLYVYWTNMVLTLDMRNDWIRMTSKEAKQYQAELISEAAQHSSKNSQNTGVSDAYSLDS